MWEFPPPSSKCSSGILTDSKMMMEGKVYTSHSYMWSNKDKLGSGATGEVYLGYHKVES